MHLNEQRFAFAASGTAEKIGGVWNCVITRARPDAANERVKGTTALGNFFGRDRQSAVAGSSKEPFQEVSHGKPEKERLRGFE